MAIIGSDASTNIIIGIMAIAVLVIMAEIIIRKSVSIARHFGISELFIGLTILSIGTSFPEYTTHIVASIDIVRGAIDPAIASATALGTNIGSDIIQQNLVVGLVALLGVLHATKKFMKRDFALMILTAVILFVFSLNLYISRWEGLLLFVGYIIYLYKLWKEEDEILHNHAQRHLYQKGSLKLAGDFLIVVVGLIVLVRSAEYILRVAVFFVEQYNIGGSLIGVMTVGVASALPEITTSIAGLRRGSSSLPLGILIGSNITNPASALGLGALISGYSVPKPVLWYDMPAKILTGILLFLFFWKAKDLKLGKKQAFAMILLYLAYIIIRIKFFSIDY